MTPEQINRAVAELCGWTCLEDNSDTLMMMDGFLVVGYPSQGAIIGRKQAIPDYFRDLNAMHEAEKAGITPENSEDYCLNLKEAMWNAPDYLWAATASQRAEAFLRTHGKWTDHPNQFPRPLRCRK